MPAYMIIQTEEILDNQMYIEYASKAKPILESYGAEYLVSSGNIKPFTDWNPKKILVIKFPDMESADKCFKSSEYQDIVHLRKGSLRSKALIVEDD